MKTLTIHYFHRSAEKPKSPKMHIRLRLRQKLAGKSQEACQVNAICFLEPSSATLSMPGARHGCLHFPEAFLMSKRSPLGVGLD